MKNSIIASVPYNPEDWNINNRIHKGLWVDYMDKEGILLCCPGSNSCWVGFDTENEAIIFNNKRYQGQWKVAIRGARREIPDGSVDLMTSEEVYAELRRLTASDRLTVVDLSPSDYSERK